MYMDWQQGILVVRSMPVVDRLGDESCGLSASGPVRIAEIMMG